MLRSKRGVIAETILYYVLAGVILFFVPNPISNAVGIGNRQNKIVQTDRVTLINDENGVPIAYRQVTDSRDEQQSITFWEWLRSLPIFVLFLMAMGIIFPPVSLVLGKLWSGLKKNTKQIVVGIDQALDRVNDPAVKDTILGEMSKVQDTNTKKMVDKIQGK